MSLQLDVSISAIIVDEENSKMKKAIAFEFFINDKVCYKEAFLVTRSGVGSLDRITLLAIRRILHVCNTEIPYPANINIYYENKDVLSYIDKIGTDEVDSLPLAIIKQLRGVSTNTEKLTSRNFKVKHIASSERDSTYKLAELALGSDGTVLNENNIKEVIENNIKDNLGRSIVETKTDITPADILGNYNSLDMLSDELRNMCERESQIDEKISVINNKLNFLKTYEASLVNLNQILYQENIQLSDDIEFLNTNVINLDIELEKLKADFNDNEYKLRELNKNIQTFNKEIEHIKSRDLSLIKYLRNEIERLIIEKHFA